MAEMITTIVGDMDAALLERRDDSIEDDEKIVAITEYCQSGCEGNAHQTQRPDSPSHFCDRHVHRSVHVTLKKWPEGMEGLAQQFN